MAKEAVSTSGEARPTKEGPLISSNYPGTLKSVIT